jgi:hypothetical protein
MENGVHILHDGLLNQMVFELRTLYDHFRVDARGDLLSWWMEA